MSKKRKKPALTDAQLEIMSIVWELGEVSVADVWRHISMRRKVARNTVQTTLVRLEEKGYLQHRVIGNAFRYMATVERQSTIRGLLRSLLNGAFQGSTEGLVMALFDEAPPSREELERIRELLDGIPPEGSQEN
jgi:predicted transcriptional regulator